MATDDQQVLVVGQAATPTHTTIPGNGQIRPKVIFAHYDGTAAGSVFVPAIKITSDGGELIAVCPCASSIAAGGSAVVSWFPGLATAQSASQIKVVGARIEATSSQNIADTTATDLHYQHVSFDTGGMANLGANDRILTVPTTGLYLVAAEVFWTYNNAGRRLAAITHNGFYSAASPAVADDSRTAIWPPVGGDGMGNPHTTNLIVGLVQATAGDFFASGAVQNSGVTLATNGNTTAYLAAILLGT